ncbi:hypothetical protein [Sphingobium nicotianae]|uniref:Uncharacterized protein n=1 Tax=Sphingobium nicotianae TaxID=2782607 RepID=A0A9X1IS07_9SPHN|nr:hypothetical protein [Sphingobium nicotianae]MBT2188041.1 hypothetical protein [Sphingobium nicotianae]
MMTCSDRFARMLHRLAEEDSGRARELQERIERLPDDALIRLLMAPESGFRFGYRRDHVDETARFLEDALTAEEVRCGHRPPPDRICWSALGDLCFRGAADAPYLAPRIDGIVVDFESPWVFGKLPHIAGEAERISVAHRGTALDRIAAALHLLEGASTRSAIAMQGLTRVILVRSDPTRPDFYTSASTTLCLARSVLRNPFVASATPSELADGLVHEAIHCACDLVEISDGLWLPGGGDSYHVKVASPWTGRALDIHTYLQACWVWYGLWHFWARAIESEAVPTEEGLSFLARAFRGFADGTAVAQLMPHRALIAPAVLEALEIGQGALLGRMTDWEHDLSRTLENMESRLHPTT